MISLFYSILVEFILQTLEVGLFKRECAVVFEWRFLTTSLILLIKSWVYDILSFKRFDVTLPVIKGLPRSGSINAESSVKTRRPVFLLSLSFLYYYLTIFYLLCLTCYYWSVIDIGLSVSFVLVAQSLLFELDWSIGEIYYNTGSHPTLPEISLFIFDDDLACLI